MSGNNQGESFKSVFEGQCYWEKGNLSVKAAERLSGLFVSEGIFRSSHKLLVHICHRACSLSVASDTRVTIPYKKHGEPL